jgi:glycerol-3-phosphate acyltransferase PlsY
MTEFTLAGLLGYLLGSIPFGLIITKILKLPDIRKIGSKNIGATNVLRTGNKLAAVLTLILDAAKGAAAVLLIQSIFVNNGFTTLKMLIAGFAAVLGHMFPIWLNFKGGKGISTTIGFFLAASWEIGILTIVLWIFIAFTTHYSSLSGILSTAIAAISAFFIRSPLYGFIYLEVVLFILLKHRHNIVRLIKQIEPKIGQKVEKDLKYLDQKTKKTKAKSKTTNKKVKKQNKKTKKNTKKSK